LLDLFVGTGLADAVGFALHATRGARDIAGLCQVTTKIVWTLGVVFEAICGCKSEMRNAF